MFKKIVAHAVKEKVGTSKVIEQFKESYDYIIIGAGAAGNVLANRLTEDGNATVLLLEAGGDDSKMPDVHMPTAAPELQEGEFNYNYKTEAQDQACKGMEKQQTYFPRGRGLGGSGTINYMSYTRGSRHDFDEWSDLGCEGWSYKDVLPYFMKSEDNANKNYLKSGYHGSQGPMKVCDMQMTPLVEAFLEAGTELGYDITDINGANQIGFSNQQAYMHDAMRWSTAHAYLRPAMDRNNLDVAIKSQVAKIILEQNHARAVEIIKDGRRMEVNANREVIVSAGAVETPKILMLSGIGPKNHLQKFELPVYADLPVGRNLQDHAMCLMEYVVERPLSINVDQSHHNTSSKEYQQFLFFTAKGYLGMASVQGGTAFFRTPLASTERLYPDLQMQMVCSLAAGVFKKNWDLKGEDLETSEANKQIIYITNALLHPRSSGTITLQSTDPFTAPLIDPKYLSHQSDVDTLVQGWRLQLEISKTVAFRKIMANISRRSSPTSEDGGKTFTDQALEEYVRQHTLTGHHATSTCAMGPAKSETSVVDPNLRVIGVRGLRVVDASVMPKVPSGNTSAPTIMLAEKASDLIRGVNTVSDIELPSEVISDEILKKKASGR